MDHHGAMQLLDKIKQNMESCIYGKKDEIAFMLTALLAGGHVLIEDVPGTGKTQMVKALALSIGGIFHRIQCNPDLLPTDITGVSIYHPKQEQFVFRPGPVMANLLLADEINRATTKTQSALLEAMEEKRVSVDGETYSLPHPFMLFATQNPIEQEGTYPLPEAQLDRFMFQIIVDYPAFEEEVQIVRQTTSPQQVALPKVLHAEDILYFQQLVRKVPVADNVLEYAVRLVQKTRPGSNDKDSLARQYLAWGAGPRASQNLILAAKCYALLHGKFSPDIEDVKAMALPVLMHRVVASYKAEAEGITLSDLITRML